MPLKPRFIEPILGKLRDLPTRLFLLTRTSIHTSPLIVIIITIAGDQLLDRDRHLRTHHILRVGVRVWFGVDSSAGGDEVTREVDGGVGVGARMEYARAADNVGPAGAELDDFRRSSLFS